MLLDLQSLQLRNTSCKDPWFTISQWQSIKTLYLYSYNSYSNTHLHLQDSKVVPNPHSSSSTLPYYFAVGYGASTSGWHILWHDPQGKTLLGAASAPQRSDGPAALPYHSPAGAPYMKAQIKKGGGGVFTIFPPPPAWKSFSIFSTVDIPPGPYFPAFLLGSSSSSQWLLLFLFFISGHSLTVSGSIF